MRKEGAEGWTSCPGGATAELPQTASRHPPTAVLMPGSGAFTQCKNQRAIFVVGNPSPHLTGRDPVCPTVSPQCWTTSWGGLGGGMKLKTHRQSG